jgi:hypothetical protein
VTPDQLETLCPCCLAGVGEQCYSTSTDEPRPLPHRLRVLTAAHRLVRCGCCHGIGWRPEGLEIKEG